MCDADVIPSYGDYYAPPESKPPSYYEAVTAPKETINPTSYSSSAGSRLTYIDFIPDGPSSKYTDLIEKVNYWLEQNRYFSLQSCETVAIPLRDGAVRTDTSLHYLPARDGRDYAYILRCWIIRLDTPRASAQVLKTVTRVPEKRKGAITITFSNAFYSHAVPFDVQFKPLSDCLRQLNDDLKENPLPGKVLRVETVKLKVTERLSIVVNMDVDSLYWTEGNFDTLFLNYIRLFYIEGETVSEEIGWRDVVPAWELNKANIQRPKFEPFSGVMYKAGSWAHMQKDKKITNIQTIETPVIMDPIYPSSASRPVINTDQSEWHSSQLTFGPNLSVKYLRVYYIKTADNSVTEPYQLTQRPFVPYRLTPKSYEDTGENVRRLGRWLDYNTSSKFISDDAVLCAETVQFPARVLSTAAVDTESTSNVNHKMTGKQVVSGIRLYVNGMYQEPPIQVIGVPPPVYFPESSSACCTVL